MPLISTALIFGALHLGLKLQNPRGHWALITLLPACLVFRMPESWFSSRIVAQSIMLVVLSACVPFATAQAAQAWQRKQGRVLSALALLLAVPLWLLLLACGMGLMFQIAGGTHGRFD